MAQSEQFHEVWAYLRDNAKPIVPNDVFELREVREQCPPSRGHIKRLQRVRPVVVVAHKREVTNAVRLRHNEAAKLGLVISKQVRPNYHLPAKALPYVRPEPGFTRIAPDHAERRLAGIKAECLRLLSFDRWADAARLWRTR